VAPNIEYALAGTPCENVVGRELCVYPQGVQALFPRDVLLAEMGVESYAGMPLWDSAGQPIGLIAVMDGKPLSPSSPVAPLLRLVATRAAAELERARIERALHDRERLFRRLTESTPDKIARYSLDARTLYVNPTLERALGRTLQQLAGKTPVQNASTPFAHRYEQHVLAVARTGIESEMEVVVQGHDGREHCDSVRFVAERDETGAIAGVLAVGRDITARRRAEQERLAHLRFVENLDKVNSAMRGHGDPEQMLGDVLDTVLAIFECDRAWLVYPCNPDAPTWHCPMEKTRPQYPGALVLGVHQPVDEQVAETFRIALAAPGPIRAVGDELPRDISARFGIQAMIAMPLQPKVGEAWLFGLHQCSYAREWTPQEEKLFQEIGRRLSDALNSVLIYRNLQKSEREFRSLAEHSPDLICRFDVEGRYLYISPVITQMTGLAPEDYIGQSIGQTRRAAGHTISDESIDRLLDAVQRTVATRQPQLCEISPSGKEVDGVLEYRLAPEIDAEGRLTSVLCIARDVTERRRDEEVQRRLNRSLRLLSNCNQLLVGAEDEATLLREVCRLVVEAGDYRLAWVSVAEQDADKTVRPIAHFGDDQGYLASLRVSWADVEIGRGPTGTAIRTGEVQISQDLLSDPRVTPWRQALTARGYRSSAALPLKDGRGTFGALTIFAGSADAFFREEIELLQELAGDLAYGMRALRTRAEHIVAQAQLEFLAHHDSLTQLPNRLLLRDRFEQAVAAAGRKHGRVAMLFLDLDGFKEINDSLGHEVGDQLLIQVARRLQSCVRSSDTVSREGGDEFVIVVSEISGPDAAARVAQQILEAMEKPFEIGGNALQSALSIGISLYPDDGTDFETLRRNSDAALFHAKDGGRNTYRFFDEQMNRNAVERLQTQASLRSALKNGEFTLHYQPLVQVSDGRIVGVEALIRWQRGGELVLPGKFIPAAEQAGLIIPIGEWVLEEACRQAVAWRAAGLPSLEVAVNLSAVQFRRGNIVQTVASALERSRLPPGLLELELTESVLLHDTETAMETLSALKQLGVKLSVDDFGTGYSSLSYLKRMAVDKLKIDQTFVRQLAESAEDAAIVRAIVQLGHTLQLTVVAEGVETEAQLEFLKANGCDQIQGYHISRPLPAQEFAGFLGRGGR
jgi:diguanylate cyclase (GGDEF)-like protein/PAS domain S-box-containing protein